MNENDEIVFPLARHVGNEGFTRFSPVAPTVAEGALLEDLPAVRGREFGRLVESHDVEVVLRGFEEDEVFAPVLVQVALTTSVSRPSLMGVS